MSVWIIDPHDPLIFRDGRPFKATPGAHAQSLPFPFPSTVAGGIRSLAGLDEQGRFAIPENQLAELRQLAVRGPILVELAHDGLDIARDVHKTASAGNAQAQSAYRWLAPAPGDALILKETAEGYKSRHSIVQLIPLEGGDEDGQTDLQSPSQLLFVGQRNYKKEKPNPHAPYYWHWHHFENWLVDPTIYRRNPIALDELGHNGPSQQVRVHVAIDPNRRAGQDQSLFDTVGMEFAALVDQQTTYDGENDEKNDQEEERSFHLHLQHARRLALAVVVDDASRHALKAERHRRLHHFGGERRLASWRPSEATIPSCPEAVRTAICEDRQCRLILLTPAFFKNGYYPTTCLQASQVPEVGVKLRAIKIDRAQVISGFDLEHGKPKGTRRLAPAGTVLFLDLQGDKEAISRWIDATWMQCLTEGDDDKQPQERRDGFGLAALGTWSKESSEAAAEKGSRA